MTMAITLQIIENEIHNILVSTSKDVKLANNFMHELPS